MTTVENKQYSVDYLDPEKRSIANAVQVFYKDGTHSEKSRSNTRLVIGAAATRASRS